MFCLDFAASFFAHRALCYASHTLFGYPLSDGIAGNLSLPFSLLTGGVAGTAAAVALYPVDLVRMYSVKPGESHFARGTIPFMTVYLGVWFTFKNARCSDGREERRTLGARFCLALGATAAASVAELPLDISKHNISGGLRSAALLGALRVPLGALLLLARTTRSLHGQQVAAENDVIYIYRLTGHVS
mmetsp:Transcript_33425/g.77116  ORF Transcript_33425/g.77116 Transcript_33425/m.77116 type:complete len:188 (+) Transcript_33425:130-693(+)